MLCLCGLFLHLLLTLEKFARLHDTNAFTFHCVRQVGLTLEEAAARDWRYLCRLFLHLGLT